MKKIYFFYIATLGSFFASLLAIFLSLGVGGSLSEERAAVIVPVETSEPEPEIYTGHLDYPDLVAGELYSVSHQTPLVADPSGLLEGAEQLPAAGIFQVDAREQHEGEFWYRVLVSNGRTDYTMYLKVEDLNWKTVGPPPSDEPLDRRPGAAGRREFMELLAAMEAGRARAELASVSESEPEPEPKLEPYTLAWTRVQLEERAAIFSSGGIWTAAFGAGILALATALALGIVVWSYKVRRWHGSGISGESGDDLGEELFDGEEPVEDPMDQF